VSVASIVIVQKRRCVSTWWWEIGDSRGSEVAELERSDAFLGALGLADEELPN
jgi:hypothetical protein